MCIYGQAWKFRICAPILESHSSERGHSAHQVWIEHSSGSLNYRYHLSGYKLSWAFRLQANRLLALSMQKCVCDSAQCESAILPQGRWRGQMGIWGERGWGAAFLISSTLCWLSAMLPGLPPPTVRLDPRDKAIRVLSCLKVLVLVGEHPPNPHPSSLVVVSKIFS